MDVLVVKINNVDVAKRQKHRLKQSPSLQSFRRYYSLGDNSLKKRDF